MAEQRDEQFYQNPEEHEKNLLLQHHCGNGACGVYNWEGYRGQKGTLYGNCGCQCVLCHKEKFGPITKEAVMAALGNIKSLMLEPTVMYNIPPDHEAACGWAIDLHIKVLEGIAYGIVDNPRVCATLAASTKKLGIKQVG